MSVSFFRNVERTRKKGLQMLILRLTGPGQHMAESSLFIACAMSLAVFDISKGVDEFGREIEPVLEFTDGTIRSVSA
jgi:hypothetical protein